MFIADIPEAPPQHIAITETQRSQLNVRVANGNVTALIESDPIYSYKGDLTMLFMDMPEVPPQYTPIIVAQASQTKQQNTDRTIGVCHPIENRLESRLSAVNSVSPVGAAYDYLKDIERRKIDDAAYLSAKMTLLQAPKHGNLMLWEGRQTGSYLSTDYNYEGPDRATVLVEIGSYKVKVLYHFVLMQSVPGSGDEGTATDDKSICPNGYMWKISTTTDPNGNLIVNSVEYQSPIIDAGNTTTDTATLAATLGMNFLGSLVTDSSGVTLNIADLPSGAIGQTVGTNITLDLNAAGHGWFVDTTPADNSAALIESDPIYLRIESDPIYLRNPVKHGYVQRVADWPYSSFHAHVRKGIYPIDWAGNASDKEQYGEQAGNKQPIAFAA
mgnify:CR=1 FL=1